MKALLATGATCLLLTVGCGGSGDADNGASEGVNWLREVERNGRTELAAPLIALNCPTGNAFRCDRLIFHFWLGLPAREMRAWVAGRRVRVMRTAPFGGEGPQHGETGLVWTGIVQPAGLTEPGGPIEIPATRPNYWAGRPAVHARVRVVAKLKGGETVHEVFPAVNLLAGYG